MDYFIQKICNIVKNIYNEISLYYLYFVGLFIIVITFKFDNEIQTILQLLGFLLILIPAIADLCKVATNIIKNKVIKVYNNYYAIFLYNLRYGRNHIKRTYL